MIYFDEKTKKELLAIKDNEKEIEDRFYKELEFGTGGLRGVIGAGTNRMNIYTVKRATQGFADYLNQEYNNPAVAVSYDSRIKSDVFSKAAAEVLAANGIKVHIYTELMPTPCLSFAVRQLKCQGGIMVTASHNPAKYNGYKVYGDDGCQITLRGAEIILDKINSLDIFNDVAADHDLHGLRHTAQLPRRHGGGIGHGDGLRTAHGGQELFFQNGNIGIV